MTERFQNVLLGFFQTAGKFLICILLKKRKINMISSQIVLGKIHFIQS